jgi:hypothetical protein
VGLGKKEKRGRGQKERGREGGISSFSFSLSMLGEQEWGDRKEEDGISFDHSHLFGLWNISSHPSFMQQDNVCIITPYSPSLCFQSPYFSLFSLSALFSPLDLYTPISVSHSLTLPLSSSPSLALPNFLSPPSLFSFGWLVVFLGGTDH